VAAGVLPVGRVVPLLLLRLTATHRVAVLVPSLVALVLLALSLGGCGGGDDDGPGPGTVARPDLTPAPAPPERLAIGVDEQNPWMFRPGAVPEGFATARDGVAAIRPARYRLFVDWAGLQPDPGIPPDLAQPNDGCLRGLAPCGAYAGIQGRLRAIAERQKADGGGWEVVIVLYGAPAWAAQAPAGCERPDTESRSRPYNDAGLAGYRGLVRALLALGRSEGVALRWWSPFNEPNHPFFVSPQRAACDATSPSLAPALYTRVVRAARAELDRDRDDHELVLGELAGYRGPSPRGTGVGEFIRALPDDVACSATVWSQHEYTQPDREQPDAVGELERVLDERPCTRGRPIWVTETGVGGRRAGTARARSPAALARQCVAQALLLERLDADPRVQAAFQFSLRDDTAYPVGLFDPTLTQTYPTLGLWQAWAAAFRAGGPPPARAADC
jgi:hypothetical protein